MHKNFISAVAAASIFITGMTGAPAHAGNDDTKRVIGALIGMAIVGAAIHESNKGGRVKVIQTHNRHRPVTRGPSRPRPVMNGHGHSTLKPRPVPSRVSHKTLPGQCLRSFENRRGQPVRAFGLRCLNNNYRHVSRLPNQCFRSDRTRQGVRQSFDARCLRAQGYHLARN